jgi:predicted nucleic acid-binding protein
MNDRVFIDTNILVYLYDSLEPEKQERAMLVVDRLIRTARATISPQVVGEFFQATTRPSRPLLTHAEAGERLRHYLAACQVVPVTQLIALEALRGSQIHGFQFWDAQIWATARLNQIVDVYSEDFNVGAIVEGVRFTNPLAEDFNF